MQPRPPHHVVVVGAGFGGLQVVHRLRGSGARITLIDQRNHHLFQPLLYQVATTILSTSEIAWPIRGLMEQRRDVTTLLARIDGVDTETKAVTMDDGTRIAFDTLVIVTGARHAYFGHDEWKEFAPGLKTIEDAITIRRHLLMAFERAERETEPDMQRALLTFSVIGAGPTGVELAGIIAELAKVSLPRSFRNIDTRTSRILLIEAGPRILSAFPENLSAYAQDALALRGVDVRTGVAVTACSAEGLTLGDVFIPCRTAIWAAGVAASPAALWLGVEGDRAGRVRVENNLTVKHKPSVFVIGDTATVSSSDGVPVPGTAPAKTAGQLCRRCHSGAAARGCFTASISISPPREPCDDRQWRGRCPSWTYSPAGQACVVVLGNNTHLLPDRSPQPCSCRVELALDLLQGRTQRAADHP